jgi:GTP-binding protein
VRAAERLAAKKARRVPYEMTDTWTDDDLTDDDLTDDGVPSEDGDA